MHTYNYASDCPLQIEEIFTTLGSDTLVYQIIYYGGKEDQPKENLSLSSQNNSNSRYRIISDDLIKTLITPLTLHFGKVLPCYLDRTRRRFLQQQQIKNRRRQKGLPINSYAGASFSVHCQRGQTDTTGAVITAQEFSTSDTD